MSISEQTLSALQELMAHDAELLTQVQGSNDAAEAAGLIARAADAHGIAVDPAELTRHFEAASRALAEQTLNDQQLDAVAGGISDDGIMAVLSIFSLGLGCAVVSFGQSIGGNFSHEGHTVKKFC